VGAAPQHRHHAAAGAAGVRQWLSLSWTVALACVQGLVRSRGVFLRTPKQAEGNRLASALWATRAETVLAIALWGAAGLLAGWRHPGVLLLGLLTWQGVVYASAPYMAWLNLHTELSAQLERRRRTERLRERAAQAGPYVGWTAGLAAAAGVVAALVLAGGSQPTPQRPSPFARPNATTTTLPRATTSPTSTAPPSSATTSSSTSSTSSTATTTTSPTTTSPTTTSPTATNPTSTPTTAPG
jgi:hypothetical protein